MKKPTFNSQAPDVPELAHQGVFQLSRLTVNCYVKTVKHYSLHLNGTDFMTILPVPQDHCGRHSSFIKITLWWLHILKLLLSWSFSRFFASNVLFPIFRSDPTNRYEGCRAVLTLDPLQPPCVFRNNRPRFSTIPKNPKTIISNNSYHLPIIVIFSWWLNNNVQISVKSNNLKVSH